MSDSGTIQKKTPKPETFLKTNSFFCFFFRIRFGVYLPII